MNEAIKPALLNALLMTLTVLFALGIYAVQHVGIAAFNYRKFLFENRWRIAASFMCIGTATVLQTLEPDAFTQLRAGGILQVGTAIGVGIAIAGAWVLGMRASK